MPTRQILTGKGFSSNSYSELSGNGHCLCLSATWEWSRGSPVLPVIKIPTKGKAVFVTSGISRFTVISLLLAITLFILEATFSLASCPMAMGRTPAADQPAGKKENCTHCRKDAGTNRDSKTSFPLCLDCAACTVFTVQPAFRLTRLPVALHNEFAELPSGKPVAIARSHWKPPSAVNAIS